jgi:hypothetical protein
MKSARAKSRVDQLYQFAKTLAAKRPDFQSVRGPGAGDHATRYFMLDMRQRAHRAFGEDCGEQKLCGETSFAVDFYFRDEETIVEIALGLPNPASEFEKDILKAIMAQELGFPVKRLVFISRPGAIKKCSQPGRTAIRAWAKKNHDLEIEVLELEGEPRKRGRRSSTRPSTL